MSEQIKKCLDLETSGFIDLTENSDYFENEVRKKIESETEHESQRFMVKLSWKLDKEQLNDNRKIAEGKF